VASSGETHFRPDKSVATLVPVTISSREGDPRRSVAAELRAALEEGGLSARELGRQLALPEKSERAVARERRNVRRWLAGTNPTKQKAEQLGRVLGRDPSLFRTTRQDEDARVGDLESRLARLEEGQADLEERLVGLLNEIRGLQVGQGGQA
jgi:transcriptional regulator with XRE-family HTH domain